MSSFDDGLKDKDTDSSKQLLDSDNKDSDNKAAPQYWGRGKIANIRCRPNHNGRDEIRITVRGWQPQPGPKDSYVDLRKDDVGETMFNIMAANLIYAANNGQIVRFESKAAIKPDRPAILDNIWIDVP